ncbi:hypothetical protein [Rhizobium sp. G21]|uniref:hypothetical protein n=1 Tax=Rhizobium sp. G21 TaxID=2758439 RepID=UPI00160425B1|nr:hypothetical protein [Rhizobium sp. G21]MBB1247441.1 hypothetical protein [Rhizobium sp. G21]
MSGFLPIIEILADAEGREEVAYWLQRCPVAVITAHHQEIRNILNRKGFPEAVRCLDAELALALSLRAPDGTFQQGPNFNADLARGKCGWRPGARREARAGDGAGSGGL